jgi:hypothetical protein
VCAHKFLRVCLGCFYDAVDDGWFLKSIFGILKDLIAVCNLINLTVIYYLNDLTVIYYLNDLTTIYYLKFNGHLEFKKVRQSIERKERIFRTRHMCFLLAHLLIIICTVFLI